MSKNNSIYKPTLNTLSWYCQQTGSFLHINWVCNVPRVGFKVHKWKGSDPWRKLRLAPQLYFISWSRAGRAHRLFTEPLLRVWKTKPITTVALNTTCKAAGWKNGGGMRQNVIKLRNARKVVLIIHVQVFFVQTQQTSGLVMHFKSIFYCKYTNR